MGRAVVLRIEPPLASRPYGSPSLTPPAWTGLRAPLARVHAWHGGGLAVPTPYHGVLAVKGGASLCAVACWWPIATPALLRWAGIGSGKSRPSNRSTIMSQLSFSSFDASLMVRDAQGRYLLATSDQILEAARQAIEQKMQRGASFSSPAAVKEYLRAKLAGFEHEVFAVLFLDTQHRLIEYAEMFRGTIDSASVYPRELVKEALRLNAAAVIVSHNHPSRAAPTRC